MYTIISELKSPYPFYLWYSLIKNNFTPPLPPPPSLPLRKFVKVDICVFILKNMQSYFNFHILGES